MKAAMAKENGDKNVAEKARVQFDFSKESLSRLDDLVKEMGRATRADIIRDALQLYTDILSAQERGAVFYIREKPDAELERFRRLA